jgi:hypothetical protein
VTESNTLLLSVTARRRHPAKRRKTGVEQLHVSGVSGRAMLKTLSEGNATAEEIAGLAKGQLRRKHDELVLALEGQVKEHHRFLLAIQLHRLEAAEHGIEALGSRIAERLEPYRMQHALLMQIPGVDWSPSQNGRQRPCPRFVMASMRRGDALRDRVRVAHDRHLTQPTLGFKRPVQRHRHRRARNRGRCILRCGHPDHLPGGNLRLSPMRDTAAGHGVPTGTSAPHVETGLAAGD